MRHSATESVLNVMFRVGTISLQLRCILGKYADGPYRRRKRRRREKEEKEEEKDFSHWH
jgi:hypothetical protein